MWREEPHPGNEDPFFRAMDARRMWWARSAGIMISAARRSLPLRLPVEAGSGRRRISLVSCVKVEKTGLKYTYYVAISDAVVTVLLFLKGWLSGNNVNKALLKYLTPIRPDRTYQRKVRSKRVIAFNIRS